MKKKRWLVLGLGKDGYVYSMEFSKKGEAKADKARLELLVSSCRVLDLKKIFGKDW